jgi:hypothetical protein
VAILLALVATACGRDDAYKLGAGPGLGLDASDESSGGGGREIDAAGAGGSHADPDSAPPIDATPRRCSAADPFTSVEPLAGPVNELEPVSESSYDAHLSSDELTLYFHGYRGEGSGDFWLATRASRDAEFGDVQRLAIDEPNLADYSASLTADQLKLYFISGRYQMVRRGSLELAISSRGSLSEPFSLVSHFDALDIGSRHLTSSFITADGASLYLAFEEANAGGIYVATELDAPVARLERLQNVNADGPFPEIRPVVSADELVLYFGRRAAVGADWTIQIFVAVRASASEPFGVPREIPELAALGSWPDWISPDLCTLYLTVNGSEGSRIHVAKR